ncbi:EpsG family protein [Enterobacter soli]|uniref:EpsG family protein n=1 Tax=Enterobacter soli TaxID=885040 RepID=UPI003ED971AB
MVYVYFILLSLPFILLSVCVNYKSSQVFFTIYSFFYVILFCASFRVGVDWYLYESYFNGDVVKFYPEVGYKLISHIYHSLGFNYWAMAFLVKLFTFFCIAKFALKYSPLPTLVIFCFFITAIQFHTDFLRQQLAFSLMLIAITRNNNIKKFFYFTLAAAIHFSSILFMPVLIISKYRRIRDLLFFSTLILFIFTVLNTTLLKEIIVLLNPMLSGVIYFEKIKFYFFFGGGGVITAGHVFRLIVLILFYFMHFLKRKSHCVFLDICFSFVLMAVFYENLLYSSETLWTRLQSYGLLFMFIYPIRYFEKKMHYRNIAALLSLFYALYSSLGLLRETDFYKYYDDYGNVIFYLSDSSYQSYKVSVLEEYWEQWQPRGADK